MTYSVSIAERRCDGLRGCLEAEAGLNRLLGAEHLYPRSILDRYGRSLTIISKRVDRQQIEVKLDLDSIYGRRSAQE